MKLPLNCSVEYIENFLSEKEANALYSTLINDYKIQESQLIVGTKNNLIKTDSFKIFFSTERLISQNSHPEEIHGKSYVWTGEMKKLREKVENFVNKEFELAMCLYYPNGKYFAPYHFDQLTSGENTILPSISLGENRQFSFKNNKSNNIYNLNLAHGSMLVMDALSQSKYTHSLLKNSAYKNGRINITFRDSNFQ
jgi:hypothetical protein